jgi:salicylate hydroxylase
MKDTPTAQNSKGKVTLNILIIGGVGGISAAFCLGRAGRKITVLESAPAIGQVGAGIQVTVCFQLQILYLRPPWQAGPNVSRWLIRWGLRERLEQVRRRKSRMDAMGRRDERDYGAPYYHIHVTPLLSCCPQYSPFFPESGLDGHAAGLSSAIHDPQAG